MADPNADYLVFTTTDGTPLTEIDVGWDNGVTLGLTLNMPVTEPIRGYIYRNTTRIGEFQQEPGQLVEVLWYIGDGVLNHVNNGDVIRGVIETPIEHEVSLQVKRKQVTLGSLAGSAAVVKQLEDLTVTTQTPRKIMEALTEINKVQALGPTRRQALNIRNLQEYMSGAYPLASIPVYAYDDPAQLQQALVTVKPASMLEIFNTWTRTNGNAYFPNGTDATGDAAAWYWDNAIESVVQPINTGAFTAFISPEEVESYDAEVTMTSPGSDDDWIAFVLAFNRDDTANLNNSLCVCVTPGASGAWPNYYVTPRMEGQSKANLVTQNNFNEIPNQGWSGKHYRLWIKRRGDQFTIYGSGWTDLTLKPESLMTFNLNDRPDLEQYKGPKSYGYGVTSQANTSYRDLVFSGGVNRQVILDITNNQVYRYNGVEWDVVPGTTIHDVFSAPRTLIAMDTNRRFQINRNGSITTL